MIEIDGAFLEGGGQILRTAISLSALTKKPCRIFNIRKKRPKPGLMTQHLLAIKAVADLCQGKLEGDYLGSEEIKFYPGENREEKIFIKIPTAGSITLILQTLIIPAIFSKKPILVQIDGGATETFFSPTLDYFERVFLKILEKFEIKIEINVLKRGYYPEGGGKLIGKIFPQTVLKNFSLTERGKLKKIFIFSGASLSLKEKKVAERQIQGAKEILGKLKLPLEEKIEYYLTDCPGSHLCLILEFENTLLGVDNLGKLGKRAEQIGKEAVLELLQEEKSNACLDKHLTDQILPYLALTKEAKIKVSQVSLHAQTNMWVIEKFIPGKFEIKENQILWQRN